MTSKDIQPPTGVDLFSQTNGMLFVREPIEGSTAWHSHPLGTSQIAKARKGLAKWLIKHKVTGVDAATIPVTSQVGQLVDGVPFARQIKEARGLRKKKANGHDAALGNAARARAALALKRNSTDDALRRFEQAKPFIAALAASMEAAAINLRQLERIIGDEE